MNVSAANRCDHLEAVTIVADRSSVKGCEECLKIGGSWVHLRMCLSCGHVGCCDSSPNRHARRHWQSSGHPIMQSVEVGEAWAWCFVDDIFFEDAPKPVLP